MNLEDQLINLGYSSSDIKELSEEEAEYIIQKRRLQSDTVYPPYRADQ